MLRQRMKERIVIHENKTIESCLWAILLILVLGAFVAIRFDYYYDLNDDMLMKDIISGNYTGVPEGHNIQMLYPISFFLSLFYGVIRQIPWYGIFFMICHFGCFYLIAVRSQQFFEKWYQRFLVVVVEGLLIVAFFLYEVVFIQYTVTAGLLGATAAFLLYTTDKKLSNKEFLSQNIISVLLVIIAYQVRTELLLLIFPYICVAGVCKWSEEKEIFTKKSFMRYGVLIGAILGGILLSQIAHTIAYGSEEWKEFQRAFDERTELYDYQKIPSYEENEEFYQSIGLDQSEQALFENYNYGIDPEIDGKKIGEVAAYAKAIRATEEPFPQRMKRSLKTYVRDVVLGQRETMGISWNGLILFGYLLVFLFAMYVKSYSYFAKLLFLFIVRSVPWLYIIYGDRAPNRITHTLYLTEFLILCAMLLALQKILRNRKEEDKYQQYQGFGNWVPLLTVALMGIFALRYVPSGLQYVQTEYERRETVNQEYLELLNYFEAHEENVYFLDVYSTVAYSEKAFRNVDNLLNNYEYLGGWACLSPCNREKIKALGMSTMEEGICNQDNVYVVSHQKREITWLQDYLDEKKTGKNVVQVDTVSWEGQPSFMIYQVRK